MTITSLAFLQQLKFGEPLLSGSVPSTKWRRKWASGKLILEMFRLNAGGQQAKAGVNSLRSERKKRASMADRCMGCFPLNRREMQILTALWELGEASADEIFERVNLAPRVKRNYLKSLLALVDNGIVKRLESGAHRFSPCLDPMQAATLSIRAIFDQSVVGPISGLLVEHAHEVSLSELEELEKLIDRYRNSNK